mmetsp:Transcript_30850/g.61494  ORF Transcript_30850/g.61494 Transcript_30850/m.61494 type:complete len:155 (+) Transcript_30850:721-1185(+)
MGLWGRVVKCKSSRELVKWEKVSQEGSHLELLLSQPPRDRTIALIFPEVKDRYPFQIFRLDCCCFRKLFLQLISSFWFQWYCCLRKDFQRSIEIEPRIQSPAGRGAIDSFDGPSYDDGHRKSDENVMNNAGDIRGRFSQQADTSRATKVENIGC